MAQFVIIRGPVNSGKSTTTQLVYKYLAPMADIGSQHLFRYRMENPFDVLVSPEVPKYVSGNSQYDFYAILTIQGKKIGIASAGDTMDKVKAAVDEFLLQHNVDIVVCCTHSYDKKGSAYRMLKNIYSPLHPMKEFLTKRTSSPLWLNTKQTTAVQVVRFILNQLP